MGLKLNGATSGSIEIDVPAVAGTDTAITIPATTGGEFIVSDSSGNIDLGPLDINGGAADDSVNIDGSGRLLVGTSTSTPGAAGDLFEVAGNAPSAIITSTASSRSVDQVCGQLRFYGQAGANEELASIRVLADGTHGSGDKPSRMVFSTTADGASSPTERMRIKNNGLHYFRSDSTSTIIAGTSSGSGATPYTFVGRYSATDIETGTDSFRVTAGGTILAVNTTVQSIASERRLKENIAPIDPVVAWNTIKNVPYYSYNFIGVDPAQVNYGPMADEVPDEMRIETDQTDDVGIIHSYNNSMLQARLYVALQTALNKIETLEAKVAQLEGGAA